MPKKGTNQMSNDEETTGSAAGADSLDRIVGPSCDGRCGQYGTCKGEVRPVTVKSGNGRRTWGRYNYCENAKVETEKLGYIVLPNGSDHRQLPQ
jgi:hypothetical protein